MSHNTLGIEIVRRGPRVVRGRYRCDDAGEDRIRENPKPRFESSGRKSLPHPLAVCTGPISNPIVQSVFPSLPELDVIGPHAVTSPVRWRRNLTARESRLDLSHSTVELCAIGNHAALDGSPRPQPAPERSGGEVLFGLLARRSEERRVGKECRSRWWKCHLIK